MAKKKSVRRKSSSKDSAKSTADNSAPAASSGVSKTDAILQYMSAHPNAKPAQVAADLNKNGFDVTPGYVSTIKSNKKAKAGIRSFDSLQGSVSVQELLVARELANRLGGVDKARQVLTVLGELQ